MKEKTRLHETRRTFRLNALAAIMSVVVITILGGSIAATDLGEAKFTGWLDTDFLGDDKPGSKPFIDAHHVYLIWDHQIDSRFRAYSEIEFEHSPSTGDQKGEIKLERAYSEISLYKGLNFRLGKFSTPFGYWTPTHWAILVETVAKPLHEANKYIPPKSVGVEFFGQLFFGSQDVQWNAFVSNGSEYIGTDKPDDRTFGGGIDARLNIAEGKGFIGGSFYTQNNPSKGNRDEKNYVGYGGFELANFDVKGEYIIQSRSDATPASLLDDVTTFYLSGRYFVIPELAGGARIDGGDDDKSGAGEYHGVTSLFVNWMPVPRATAKVEYNIHRFGAASKDAYNSWALYFGLIF